MAALFLFAGMMFVLGIVYPICGVIIYKLCGSKKTIMQILAEL